MNAREEHYLEQIIERHNKLAVGYVNGQTERDTLLVEINTLRSKLLDAYRELAELKGLPPESIGEIDLQKILPSNL